VRAENFLFFHSSTAAQSVTAPFESRAWVPTCCSTALHTRPFDISRSKCRPPQTLSVPIFVLDRLVRPPCEFLLFSSSPTFLDDPNRFSRFVYDTECPGWPVFLSFTVSSGRTRLKLALTGSTCRANFHPTSFRWSSILFFTSRACGILVSAALI